MQSKKSQDKETEDFLGNQKLQRKTSDFPQLQLKYTYSGFSNFSECDISENEQPYQDTTDPAKFIKDEQLHSYLNEKKQQFKTITCINNEEILVFLMYKSDWNYQNVGNSSFYPYIAQIKDKIEQYCKKESNTIKSQGQCNICYKQSQLWENYMCNHSFCIDCWKQYIQFSLAEGKIYFNCLSEGCLNSPVLPSFVDKVAPQFSRRNWKKIYQNLSKFDKNLSYCPKDDCPYFCQKNIVFSTGINNVFCQCGNLYCFMCEKESHYPTPCQIVSKWNDEINSENTNSSWIKLNTIECPKCKLHIEKTVGCSRMVCQCKCIFCYQCGKAWDENHNSTGKVECYKRKDLVRNKEEQAQVVQFNQHVEAINSQTEKYLSSFDAVEKLFDPQNPYLSILKELKIKVWQSLMSLKWVKIKLFLQKNAQVEEYMQKEYKNSIESIVKVIDTIKKHSTTIHNSIELNKYEPQLRAKQELLAKNEQAWNSCYSSVNV